MNISWEVEIVGVHESDYMLVEFAAEVDIYPGEPAVLNALPEDCYPGYPPEAEFVNSTVTSITDVAGGMYRQVGLIEVGKPLPERYALLVQAEIEEIAIEKHIYDDDEW